METPDMVNARKALEEQAPSSPRVMARLQAEKNAILKKQRDEETKWVTILCTKCLISCEFCHDS